jgi:hypothetical protein
MDDKEAGTYKLSEQEKEQRILNLRARFEAAMPTTPRQHTALPAILPDSPRALLALAIAAVLVLTATLGWLAH